MESSQTNGIGTICSPLQDFDLVFEELVQSVLSFCSNGTKTGLISAQKYFETVLHTIFNSMQYCYF